MNKQKAIERLNALEIEKKELHKIIEQPEITKEQRFLELINGCVLKIDKEKYPNSVFYFKDDKIFLQIEKSNLWVNYKNIWSVFESEFSMQCKAIQSFITSMAEEHFKCKGLTAIYGQMAPHLLAEEHFKCKGLTAGL